MKSFRNFIPPSLYELQELEQTGFWKLTLEALATGVITGLVIGIFRITYTLINSELAAGFLAHAGSPLRYLGTAGYLGLCALVGWLMLRHEPLISGSGIPQVELVLRGKLPMPWRRILWTKFIGTLASLSGGLSVGREGPCIQMGAAVGCGVGTLWHDDFLRPRFLVGGSTAGMAAAFGAPLAGLFFAFEEMHTLLTLPMLLFTILTATGAWLTVDVLLRLGLVFPLADTTLPLHTLWLAPVAGMLCGLLAVAYNRLLVGLALFMDRSGLRQPWRLGAAFALGGMLLFLYPQVMAGIGPGIPDAARNVYPFTALLLLWVIKILFNCASFSSGVAGGILMPMLVAGGFTGALLACGLTALGLAPGCTAALVILGMAGLFSGTVRAPLTGSFLITEMTGAWSLLPAILVCCAFACFVANRLKSPPVYDSLRDRQLRNFRLAHHLPPVPPARGNDPGTAS